MALNALPDETNGWSGNGNALKDTLYCAGVGNLPVVSSPRRTEYLLPLTGRNIATGAAESKLSGVGSKMLIAALSMTQKQENFSFPNG